MFYEPHYLMYSQQKKRRFELFTRPAILGREIALCPVRATTNLRRMYIYTQTQYLIGTTNVCQHTLSRRFSYFALGQLNFSRLE